MPELIHSELPDPQQRRLIRIGIDVCALQHTLTRAQILTVYDTLETIRDALSKLLDKADGKNAQG